MTRAEAIEWLVERYGNDPGVELALHAVAPPVEPVAWMYQHEETGQVGFVDEQQIEWGFWTNNPRLHAVSPLYAHPPVEPVKEADVSAIRDAALEEAAVLVERCPSPRKRAGGRVEVGNGAREAFADAIRALRGGTP